MIRGTKGERERERERKGRARVFPFEQTLLDINQAANPPATTPVNMATCQTEEENGNYTIDCTIKAQWLYL